MRAWDFATRAFADCRIHRSSRAMAFCRRSSVRCSTAAARLLLLEPGGIVSLPRNSMAVRSARESTARHCRGSSDRASPQSRCPRSARDAARASSRFPHPGGSSVHRAAGSPASSTAAAPVRRDAARHRIVCPPTWSPGGQRNASIAISTCGATSHAPSASIFSCSSPCFVMIASFSASSSVAPSSSQVASYAAVRSVRCLTPSSTHARTVDPGRQLRLLLQHPNRVAGLEMHAAVDLRGRARRESAATRTCPDPLSPSTPIFAP